MMITTEARLNGQSWPVKVYYLGNGNYEISGRGTMLHVLIRDSYGYCGGDYLVAVSNYHRCGCLNDWIFNGGDIQQHVGIENTVDAYTLAAGLRAIYQHRNELGEWLG
ncbi:MAG: hypothetical protein K6U80_18875 [Firmicutes bacterium]|nr:hypothetical protein [Bacillota bacterium]